MMNMNDALNALRDVIVADYAGFNGRSPYGNDETKAERVAEFAEGITFEEGRKYIKVVKKLGMQHCVWGFIVKEDDKKFMKGDILKAAGWNAPARNAARGNVFGEYKVQWTGPNYLR